MKITEIIKKVIKHDNDVVNLSEQLDNIKNNHLVLNIKDFGATGQEEQDISDILINLLNTITTPSATIKFPNGVYNITKEIELPQKTLIFIGEGVEGTIIKNNSNNIIRSFFYKNSENTKRFNCFKDIQFNCNKKVNRAIFFERGNGTKISHCRFINHLQAGIWFEAIESMTGAVIYESEIVGNYFRGVEGSLSNDIATEVMPPYNIYFGSGATDSILRDNISINAKTHLYLNGGNNMIRDNHFFDYPVPQYNSKCHIHLNGTNSILGNYFDSPVCGIKVTGERFLVSNNNFFWGNEEIDRTGFVGISLELTSERKRGVVITNNFFNPIGSNVGYDIKVDSELELPMIINNRTMNVTNIYEQLIKYSDSSTRKVTITNLDVGNLNVSGNVNLSKSVIPSTNVYLGNSSSPFHQITTNLSPKCNLDNYNLNSFPESINKGSQELITLIKNLSDRVKVLENK